MDVQVHLMKDLSVLFCYLFTSLVIFDIDMHVVQFVIIWDVCSLLTVVVSIKFS